MWCNIHVSLAPVSSLFEKKPNFIIFGQLALVITKLAQFFISKRNINYGLPYNHIRTYIKTIIFEMKIRLKSKIRK